MLKLGVYVLGALGPLELTLRVPPVMAETACCWLAYLWLKEVTDRSTAFMGLLLLSFAPSLIGLSAEVRQYALLLFFMAGCLYLSERAIQENSQPLMVLFSLCLYGALLTHYSSLLFALTMGIYMLLRLYPYEKRAGLFAAWVCGQIGALPLVTYFLVTHVAHLRATGMPPDIPQTFLRKPIFHPPTPNP